MLGLVSPFSATAAPFDGTTPLLCALIQVLECAPGGACERRRAEDVNLPQFIKVDPQAKTLAAPGPDGRTAPVQAFANVNGKVVLYGGQEGRSWSAVIQSETGKMSASVVDDQATFVIFGACTAP